MNAPLDMTRFKATYKGLNKIARRDGTGIDWFPRGVKGVGALPGEPFSVEFDAAYAALTADKNANAQKTLAGLFKAYETTAPAFAGYSARWQRELTRKYELVCAHRSTPTGPLWGTLPYAVLESKKFLEMVIDWRDSIAASGKVRAADMMTSAIATVIAWAAKKGTLATTPLVGIEQLYVSHRVDARWSQDDLNVFRETAGIELWAAALAAVSTGQREADLLRLTRQGKLPANARPLDKKDTYDGTFIWVERSKGRKKKKSQQKTLHKATVVGIPCVPALRQLFDGFNRAPGEHMLQSKRGEPWGNGHFCNMFAAASDAAGIVDLNFHDLRGTAVTWLADMGCSIPQIRAITGHSLQSITKILEHYLGETPEQAAAAIDRLSEHPTLKALAAPMKMLPAPQPEA